MVVLPHKYVVLTPRERGRCPEFRNSGMEIDRARMPWKSEGDEFLKYAQHTTAGSLILKHEPPAQKKKREKYNPERHVLYFLFLDVLKCSRA